MRLGLTRSTRMGLPERAARRAHSSDHRGRGESMSRETRPKNRPQCALGLEEGGKGGSDPSPLQEEWESGWQRTRRFVANAVSFPSQPPVQRHLFPRSTPWRPFLRRLLPLPPPPPPLETLEGLESWRMRQVSGQGGGLRGVRKASAPGPRGFARLEAIHLSANRLFRSCTATPSPAKAARVLSEGASRQKRA